MYVYIYIYIYIHTYILLTKHVFFPIYMFIHVLICFFKADPAALAAPQRILRFFLYIYIVLTETYFRFFLICVFFLLIQLLSQRPRHSERLGICISY